jgi:hypothetical protein
MVSCVSCHLFSRLEFLWRLNPTPQNFQSPNFETQGDLAFACNCRSSLLLALLIEPGLLFVTA